MTIHFWDSVKEGFTLVNRNWQLVLIRVAASLISFIGFFIIVGIPFAIAVVAVGVNLLAARPDAFLEGLKDVLTRGYFGIALLLVTGLLVYVIFAASLWLYVLAGSFGLLAANLKEPQRTFSMKEFFSQGKRLFWPFTRFYSIIGLFMFLVFVVLGLSVGGAVFLISVLKEWAPLLSIFVGAVLGAIIFITGVFVVVGIFALSVFGAGLMVLYGPRGLKPAATPPLAWESVKGGWNFLKANPRGFWGMSLLLFCYLFISLFLLILAYPFGLIPVIGTLIVLPYQIIVSAVQRYLGLVLAGTAFSYYFRVSSGDIRAKAPAQAGPPPGETPPG